MAKGIVAHLKKHRKSTLMAFDILAVTFSYLLTWVLISSNTDLQYYLSLLVSSCIFFVGCYTVVYALMGMYNSLWRYAEIVEFFRFCLASALAVSTFLVVTFFMFEDKRIPVSVYLLSAMFASAITLYARLTYRMYRNTKINRRGTPQVRRVLMIGSGDVASTILYDMQKNPQKEMNIICVVDDNPARHGRFIMGVEIMGKIEDIPDLVERCAIETILFAVPHVEESEKRRIFEICAKTNCNMRTVPDLRKIISNDEHSIISRIRDVKSKIYSGVKRSNS